MVASRYTFLSSKGILKYKLDFMTGIYTIKHEKKNADRFTKLVWQEDNVIQSSDSAKM